MGGTTTAARNIISGNQLDGVLLNLGAGYNTVDGDFIGTNLAGNASLANSGNGVKVLGSSNTVGGTTAAAGNVISGNLLDGVLLGLQAACSTRLRAIPSAPSSAAAHPGQQRQQHQGAGQ